MRKNLTLLAVFLLCFTNIFAGDGMFEYLKNKQQQVSSDLLIIFYRQDCPYCEKMNTVLQDDPGFTNVLLKKYNIQVLDIKSEQGRAMADRFNVHSVPTIINYNSQSGDHQLIKGFPGVQKFSDILKLGYKGYKRAVDYTSAAVACGDGIIDAGEGCDDGGLIPGDGCSPTCQVEPGFFCGGSPSVCATVCGDGIPAGSEGCDDGNVNPGDGCSPTCTIEANYSCTGSPSVCTSSLPANDECSGAITISGVSGTVAANNSLATNSALVKATCWVSFQKDLWYSFTLPVTRNITIAINGVSMTDPTLAIYSGTCGSLVQVGCDDDSGPGFFSFYTGTLAAGTYYLRAAGFGSSAAGQGSFNIVYNFNGICGNGVTEYGEQCDDGNLVNGDGCSSTCTSENVAGMKGVAINEDGVGVNPAAMLDVKSDNKGVLIPRLTTTQRNAITAVPKGLIVYDITTGSFWYYKTNNWSEINGAVNTGFSATTNPSTQAISNNNFFTFSTEQYDDGNNFAANSFTAPSGGVYELSSFAAFSVTSVTAASVISVSIENSAGSTVYGQSSIYLPIGFVGTIRLNPAISTKLAASDIVKIKMLVAGTLAGTVSNIVFSGYKVY